MRQSPFVFLTAWLSTCLFAFGAGSWNGIAITGWNDIAITAWNGTGISAAGGGGGPTYLLEENFEDTATPGYDAANWVESGTATPDEKYSTTGLSLQSSQCIRFALVAQTGISTNTLGASYSTIEYYCLLRVAAIVDVEAAIFRFQDSSSATVAQVMMRTTGTLRIRAGATASPQSNTTDALATNTTYHVWFRYVKGTGADAFASVEFNTTGTRAGSGTKYISVNTGPATTDANKIQIGPSTGNTSEMFMDRVLLLDGSIGNSP